jgi:hypothetical protein
LTGWSDDRQQALRTALNEFDHLEVQRLCRQFMDEIRRRPELADAATGLTVLKLLQRKRNITLLQDVAETLLVRAAEDAVVLPDYPHPAAEAAQIAEAILEHIVSRPNPDFWEFATAAEACLVLNRHDDGVEWLARYVGSDADAFEYNSTLRQFEQIWRLDTATRPGLRFIPLLRNRLLQTEGGTLSVTPNEYAPSPSTASPRSNRR